MSELISLSTANYILNGFMAVQYYMSQMRDKKNTSPTFHCNGLIHAYQFIPQKVVYDSNHFGMRVVLSLNLNPSTRKCGSDIY